MPCCSFISVGSPIPPKDLGVVDDIKQSKNRRYDKRIHNKISFTPVYELV